MQLRHGLVLACSLISLGACGRIGYETIASSTAVRDASDSALSPLDGGSADAPSGTTDTFKGYGDPGQAPGTLSLYVGTSTRGFDDGPVATATLNHAFGLLWTPKGLYIADSTNAAVRLLKPTGQVDTIVGRAGPGFQDGPTATAKLSYPVSLALDAQGRLLMADEHNHAIRRLNANGTLETIAGTGVAGFKDGTAALAQFNSPRALLLDKDGSLLIADKDNGLIRRLRDGLVSVVCGRPGESHAVVDGDCASTAKLEFPTNLSFDSNGDLLVCEWAPNVIRRITPAGEASTWAGKNNVRGYVDSVPSETVLSRPTATVPDPVRGGIWIIEQEGGHRIRYFNGTTIAVVAGPATSAFVQAVHKEGANPTFAFPETAILDPEGCLLLAEGVPLISRYCP